MKAPLALMKHTPDVDIGLGERAKHGGGHALAAGHLVPHRRQHAAAVDLLHLADAPRSDGLREPARRTGSGTCQEQ